MKHISTRKNKHLNLSDRLEIESGLIHGSLFKDIALNLGKDPSTIGKEIRRNIIVKENKDEVVIKDSSGNVKPKPLCPQLIKSPYVCNGCAKKRHRCPHTKQFYYAKHAQRRYEETLVDSRSGIPLTKESFYELDKKLSEGIKKGQRLYHISQSTELSVSNSSIYRYLHKGYLSVNKFDFPRVVKFKARRAYQKSYIPKESKKGRTYNDFKDFLKKSEYEYWVEMDTVVGRVGGKAIITFNFSMCNFIFGLLIDDKTSLEVTNKIHELKKNLTDAHVKFGDVIPILLTDNGTEFANIWAFINDLEGHQETNLFFCDPYQSSQKAKVEKSHTLFRDIVPKGESFDHFTQTTVNNIFSHVNSVKRKGLNGKSPYELFSFYFTEHMAHMFGIVSIPPEQVIQSPKLLQDL